MTDSEAVGVAKASTDRDSGDERTDNNHAAAGRRPAVGTMILLDKLVIWREFRVLQIERAVV
jgi:hypothetical protein